MTPLYTTEQVAKLLNRHPGHVRRLAIAHNIGQKLNTRMRVFTDEDIERLQARNTKRGPVRKAGTE